MSFLSAEGRITKDDVDRWKSCSRIIIIDVVRGAAIIGVVIFHLVWDLDLTGLIKPGLSTSTGWLLYGRLLAGTFMFVVGISLALAHAKTFRWRAFTRRLVIVAGAAIVITVSTKIAFPQNFIYFGILHAIVAGSLVGILFLRAPVAVTLICGVAIWTLPLFFRSPLFDTRWMAWIGFSEQTPSSVDFVPVFPWLGLVLLGLALSKMAISASAFDRLNSEEPRGKALAGLVWCGRHSLVIYLIHQPLLLAVILPVGKLVN